MATIFGTISINEILPENEEIFLKRNILKMVMNSYEFTLQSILVLLVHHNGLIKHDVYVLT